LYYNFGTQFEAIVRKITKKGSMNRKKLTDFAVAMTFMATAFLLLATFSLLESLIK